MVHTKSFALVELSRTNGNRAPRTLAEDFYTAKQAEEE